MRGYRKKQRGQWRRCEALLRRIDAFVPFAKTDGAYAHFHVPCDRAFLESRKTHGSVRTAFCRKWLETAARFILAKPPKLSFCRVVAVLCVPEYAASQLIIFYDEAYFKSFWERKTPQQRWVKLGDARRSLVRARKITTSLTECGYLEEVQDEAVVRRDFLWFYGEL